MLKSAIVGLAVVLSSQASFAAKITKTIQIRYSVAGPDSAGQISYDDNMATWSSSSMDPNLNCEGTLDLSASLQIGVFGYVGAFSALAHGTKAFDPTNGQPYCKAASPLDVPELATQTEFSGVLESPETGAQADMTILSLPLSTPIRFSGGRLSVSSSECEFLVEN